MIRLSLHLSEDSRKKPDWLKVTAVTGSNFREISDLIRRYGLHTVCEKAACPNIFECFRHRTVTFLILGDKCSRNCRYCQVKPGRGAIPDPNEPENVAKAISELGLRYAVITSVTRDDLPDGGAAIFANTIKAIRRLNSECLIETLIPDFKGDESSLKIVAAVGPDVLAHNIETVANRYPLVRPQANYKRTLEILAKAKKMGLRTKSGIMVGLGETNEELLGAMNDLRAAQVDIFTAGQYLRPSPDHAPVSRYYYPEEFALLKKTALKLGFSSVNSGPLVRSSYRAGCS